MALELTEETRGEKMVLLSLVQMKAEGMGHLTETASEPPQPPQRGRAQLCLRGSVPPRA